ncbi:Sec-independent protein translocase subunit TatA [Planomonospora sp. ID67723]|uniref:Sec-independent protein translocase subunit TatA n=1 Tax=Planomonospora sp. ID67723 TaxID=2738134 RepID=UPI0018C3B715|nr:Sec-independent protein translocase subunit TatA [Planomonospora sp. ID67723]MBG0833065.1 Sec-independent protein translocase subunit TatA [Planomonospora sp. ID67723]
MPNLGTTELIIIGLILVLLFGAKKLPEAARGLGRSLRIFKSETAKLRDDDEPATVVQAQQVAPAPQQIATPAPAAEPSAEEQARVLEEQAARLRAQAGAQKPQ